MLPFTRVLIANRGEIAVRVIRTLRRLGIVAVAVRTPQDAGSLHAARADVVAEVPSYLDAGAMVAAARATGAQAIHPGYGFLSESPVLARACVEAGLTWIGPPPAALELMGDKIAAKAHVAALGVPVVPGLAENPDPAAARDAGWSPQEVEAQIGFPLMVKPSAGGGGKGMQVVRAAAELPDALAAARRVAAAAFGDDRLLLERYVAAPRHIEAQVAGAADGAVELLGLRECSLQRRHQKVIEEAPAPFPQGPTRELIGTAAVRIARSVAYVGVGTVEFLVSGADPGQWYFLEMNTRLQVEHPVTEAVTGLDLVEVQLWAAAGLPLPLGRQVHEHGHAVEARVYAERPERGFVPSTGDLLVVDLPRGVRVDSGVDAGSQVLADYDPMLLKVIAHADTREEAFERLDAALARTVVLGVHTNIAYLRHVLAATAVREARADTAFLDTFEPPPPPEPDAQVLAAAASELWPRPSGEPTLWAERSGWRLGEHRLPTLALVSDDATYETTVSEGVPTEMRTAVADGVAWVGRGGHTWRLRRRSRADVVEQSRRSRGQSAPDPQVRTPMPGTVVAVVAVDKVPIEAGAVIAVVEAMKMENQVTAPAAGILELAVRPGEKVAADQLLATVHPDPHGPQDQEPGTS